MSITATARSSSPPGKRKGAATLRRSAIDIAIEALNKPQVASLLTVGPLPEGMETLLRIVADGEWRDGATEHVYRKHSAETVRAASAAFLSIVLFAKPSEHYRVLGLPSNASSEEVRENKRLLLKWLHPDRNPRRREQEYLSKVVEAADAIENRRVTETALPGKAPQANRRGQSPAQGTTRSKTNTRPISGSTARTTEWRRLISRSLAAMGIGIRRGTYAVISLLVLLITWRYLMHEPIGVSIVRYSESGMALFSW